MTTSKRRLPSVTTCDTIQLGAVVVGLNAKLGNAILLFDLKVGESFHRRQAPAQRLGQVAHGVEVIAVNLQCDFSANAGQHVVHPVRDGLSYTDGCRQHRKACAYLTEYLIAGARGRLEIDIDLAEMNALRVLVEFRPSGAAADRRNLGYLHQKTFGNQPEAVGLVQRYPGIVLQADVERALVEWRQEGAGQ
jgi:hypothetical protein